MRWKFLKKFINELDLELSEKNLIPIEKSVADFIKENLLKQVRLNKLHVLARIYYSGEDDKSPPLEF